MESSELKFWPNFDRESTVLTTDRLLLRFPKPEEEERVIDLTFDAAHTVDENGRRFTEGMQWNPPVEKSETREFMQKNKIAWNDGFFNFAIFLYDSTPIGRCVIRPNTEKESYEIGYWMHPKFQGNGYMTEAASELIRFGFTELQLERITAAAATWNTASVRVLIKSGLNQLPRESHHITTKNGQIVPQYWFELTRKAWLSNQQ
jgi:[ribosomal protein S5]-alanine N-acetyltransferase